MDREEFIEKRVDLYALEHYLKSLHCMIDQALQLLVEKEQALIEEAKKSGLEEELSELEFQAYLIAKVEETM